MYSSVFYCYFMQNMILFGERNFMSKRIHKPEYFYLKMPFSFDMVCSDRRKYQIQMTFLYQYNAKDKTSLKPSIFYQKPMVRRLHFFMTRLFLSYMNYFGNSDFPIEWQEYFSVKSKYAKARPYPYANDDNTKKYMSFLIAGSFRDYMNRQKGIEGERIRTLTADLNILNFDFLINDCVPQKKIKHKPLDKVVYVYKLYDDQKEKE